MAEYIDRGAFQAALVRKQCGPANKRYTEGWNDCLLRVKSMVSKASSADVAPVVRCKDCAFSQSDGWVCCSSAALMPRRTFPDSFCSDGEKKDEVNES